jgi:hypothetical protein
VIEDSHACASSFPVRAPLGPVLRLAARASPCRSYPSPRLSPGRIADRLVFEHVIAALVHGSGYERIATPGCSDRTIRRRLRWGWPNRCIA